MAADESVPTVSSLRRIMKPVISTDMMGNRNVEVKAVCARAEPAVYYSTAEVPDAVRAAREEEEKIQIMQTQKAVKLHQFQKDVKKRVRQMTRDKRKQEIEENIQTMEKQHNQVRSSMRASDCLTERKDRVLHKAGSSSSLKAVSASLPSKTNGKKTQVEAEKKQQAFEKHNQQLHRCTNEARRKLSGRKVYNDVHGLEKEMLPGGKWATHTTRACSTKKQAESDEESSDDLNNSFLDFEHMKKSLEKCKYESGHTEQKRCASQNTNRNVNRYAQEARGEDQDEDKEKNEKEESDGEEDKDYYSRLQRVQFHMSTLAPPVRSGKLARKKASQRPQSAPDLSTGVKEIAERRRQEQQKLTYRRLYSDLERQAVRDQQRRKKQRLQIQKIKKEKEELRRLEEENARRMVEPRDPVTGETSKEADLRQQLERSHLQEVLEEREGQRQKQKEMTRYLDALRTNLREKMNKQGLELPSLCCCGETLWDTHPDTCANNCFYYKNHRAYARALQSLLNSSLAV